MKIYLSPISQNARRVRIALHELALEVAIVEVDLMAGEQRHEAFLAINPNGRIPALVADELRISESRAIVQYLAERSDERQELWAASDVEHAQQLHWMFWDATRLAPHMRELQGQLMFSPAPDAQRVEASIAALRPAWEVLDAHLSRAPFLVGRRFTLGDASLAATLTYAAKLQLALESYPSIAEWMATVGARASWRETVPSMA
ncbi:MAG: glutathione S-transferase family protein [Myxococcota bacterium]